MSYLSSADPEIAGLIDEETERQRHGLELIASENYVSEAVLEALGSPLTNKYSEGYPGKRYYGGNQTIDKVEALAIERAKRLFGAEHVNVQPHAGAQANFAVYLALCKPGDTILAMDLAHGGHLTHGSPVNFSGKWFTIVPYGVRKDDERVDMDQVRALAREKKPRMILAGFSAYPRTLDFAAFAEIAREVGAYLFVDMAHIAGLVAANSRPIRSPRGRRDDDDAQNAPRTAGCHDPFENRGPPSIRKARKAWRRKSIPPFSPAHRAARSSTASPRKP